ncbi:MAG: McrC family protein [Spirochaetia bacterium]|nr:McrC family protein [Spirochaetia bacterium]
MAVIKVFEFSHLAIDQTFTQKHFEQLVRYNEIHGNKFFNVGNKRIYLKNYVGVIQVGNLVIEILPKSDKSKNEETKNKWHNALIYMLHICGYLRIESITRADLKLQNLTLIDLFYKIFLDEVNQIVHQGLIRKYRYKTDNRPYLKGKLLFNKHISENYLHKEMFYTSAQVYDHNNVYNQILLKALRVLKITGKGNSHYSTICNLIFCFDEIGNIEVNDKTFDSLSFARNNMKYKSAITLARLILQNYSPDLKNGLNNVIGLLFDMNTLFEKVVYKLLKPYECIYQSSQLNLSPQYSKKFWNSKTIRPDILGEYCTKKSSEKESFIIDTKWKRPHDGNPTDDDLKQMFAYNIQFGAHQSILLYPDCDDRKQKNGFYGKSKAVAPEYANHSCSTFYIDLFNSNGKINKNAGDALFKFLLENKNKIEI